MTPFDVAPPDALPLLHDPSMVWIDVREAEEWDFGHLPGCRNMPMSSMKPADFACFPKEQKMILVCRSGSRSARVTRALHEMGFVNAHNLFGGLLSLNAFLSQKVPVMMH